MSQNKMHKCAVAVKLGLVVTAAAFTMPALAQQANQAQATAPQATEQQVEVIEVRGIRRSLESAMNTKRFADAVVDAVSAEDIGKFPDKNIAESLQRIAGVSINRGFVGEGAEVSIRGVDPTLTQVQMNGQFVASTAWFSQGANKRSFNMDLMPSEMIKGLEVYKSPVASIDEGGVGGTVILRTRKPLELDAGTVFTSVESNMNSLADDKGFGASVLGSWKNDNETFGILAMVSSLETIGRARKAENYWEESWSASGIAGFDQDRERQAFDITAQFAVSEQLDLTLHAFRTELDAFNTNQNFLVIGADAASMTNTAGGRVAPNKMPLKGTVNRAAWFVQDTNTRGAKMTSDVLDFTAAYKGDGYKLTGVIGTTSADGGNGGNANGLWGLPVNGTNGITVDVNMDLPNSMLIAPKGVDPANASWQRLQGTGLAKSVLQDEETYAQLDLNKDVDLGVFTSFDTGLKVRTHQFTNQQFDATLRPAPAGMTIADFADGQLTDFSNVMAPGSTMSYVKLDGRKYFNFLNNSVTRWDESRSNFGQIEEDIFAAYAQGNFSGEGFRGNLGLRYVATDTVGRAYNGRLTGIETFKGDYSDFLPSFNLALDLDTDVILRMSAAKVMTRPGYSQLTPGYRGLPSSPPESGRLQSSRGNPALDPFRATQMDVGVEWYYNPSSLLSVSLFNKDIASFISTKKINENLVTVPVPGMYEVSVPDQGRGGKIEGVEFQWQTNFGNGFGLLANATYVDATGQLDDGTKITLPGSSQTSYNLTGYYEHEYFTTRLAYTTRSDFFAEGTALGNSNDLFDGQSFIDASVVWHATSNLDVALEGVNLGNEITYQRHSTGAETVRVITENGRRYSLKASYRF